MGRARFLLGLRFINRAAMGRARSCSARGLLFLTARPWAERGSCSARCLLTARPWAERGSCSARGLFFFYFFFNRAAMGRARFMFYPLFIFFNFFLTARPWAERGSCFTRCLFFVCHQTQTSSRRTLNHTICHFYSRKLLKHKYTDNVTDIGALIHGNCYGYCFL